MLLSKSIFGTTPGAAIQAGPFYFTPTTRGHGPQSISKLDAELGGLPPPPCQLPVLFVKKKAFLVLAGFGFWVWGARFPLFWGFLGAEVLGYRLGYLDSRSRLG